MTENSARLIAHAITADAAPGHDETGGCISSLTEAVMGMTAAICRVAEAIQQIADSFSDNEGRTIAEIMAYIEDKLKDHDE